MIKKQINQKDSLNIELLNSIGCDYVFNNSPINRLKNKVSTLNKLDENKHEKLLKLKQEIDSIKDCKLKKNASRIVFAAGNMQSSIMIVGEGPGQKEDDLGKPFVGDAGNLLNKMLEAIKIKRKKIYITNVVNYRPPNNRKPEQSEINRYSIYLKKHISIIDPKILILMGSTAMEALLGTNKKYLKKEVNGQKYLLSKKTTKLLLHFIRLIF